MIRLDKGRVKEILESHGVINVTFNNNPVWLESIGTDKDNIILVKDLETGKHMTIDIKDLEE